MKSLLKFKDRTETPPHLQALDALLALCALPPPPPEACASGEFAADPDALEADQEQMLIYVEEMLVAGSALTGAWRERESEREIVSVSRTWNPQRCGTYAAGLSTHQQTMLHISSSFTR